MLCAIAPGNAMFEETVNTLKYANRAKEIKVTVEENKKVVELHIAEYKGIINDLRKEIDDLSRRAKGMEYSNIECPLCTISDEVEGMIETFTDLLDEQMQLRKTVCDIKAQNLQNRLEMAHAKEATPTDIAQLENLASIEKSVDLNKTIKNETEARINLLSKQAEKMLGAIQSRIKSKDSRAVLEKIVQLKATQIENLELEINLNYYEKLNKLLMEEYKSLERQLNEHQIDPGMDEELAQVDEEEIDPEETQEEMEELKKALQESGIHFEDNDQEARLKEDEEAASRYAGMEQSALTQPSQALSLDVSFEDEEIEPAVREDTPEKLVREKDVVVNPNFEKAHGRFLNSQAENDQIHYSDHGLPPMGSNRQSLAMKRISTAQNPDRDTNLGRESNALYNRESYQSERDNGQDFNRVSRPSTANQIVSKNDMINEMNLLNTVDKELLNFERENSIINQDRMSTIRGSRKQKKTQWNLTICWGEEFKVYGGDFFPESAACFEGEVDIGDKDFEELLTEDEMKLLRNIELGEEF